MESLKKQLPTNRGYKIGFGITFCIYLGIDLYLITLFQKLVDAASDFNKDLFFKQLGWFVAVLVMTLVFIVLEQLFFRKMAYYGEIDLKKCIFRSFLHRRHYYDGDYSPGKISGHMNNDSPVVAKWLSSGRTTTLIQLLILFVCLVILASYSLVITAFIGVVIVLTYSFAKYISNTLSRLMKAFQEMLSDINIKTLEGLESMALIKQLGKETYFAKTVEAISRKKYKGIMSQISRYRGLEKAELNFLAEVLPILILLLGMLLTIRGDLSVGSAFAMMLITQKLNEPIIVLADLLTDKKTADQVYESMAYLFENQIAENDHGIKHLPSFESLEIDIKAYTYPLQKEPVLKDIHWTLYRGQLITLKGASGRGKSTLIHLISRLIDPSRLEGSIEYNGERIDRFDLKAYYSHVLQVEQTTVLIEGSIKENLCLGEPFSKEAIDEVIYTCCLEDFVGERGLDYLIEENGENISGGEKQRLGLARMLLRHPDLLILDEVTSALNESIRQEVVRRLLVYKKQYNLTLMAISHNDDFEAFSDVVWELV